MLGEIHIALLRLIIKDTEDIARTPDPNSAGIPAGGHPHIVEGVCFTRCWFLLLIDYDAQELSYSDNL